MSSFSALQHAITTGETGPTLFYAFDLLYLDGKDLRRLPLVERKALLMQSIDDLKLDGRVRFSEHLTEDGAAMARHACRLGLEGIIAKRSAAPYHSGRSDDWRKIKCTTSQEFVIAGYNAVHVSHAIGRLVDPRPLRRQHARACRPGRYRNQQRPSRANFWTALDPLRTATSAFSAELPPLARRNAKWVEPHLVCEVTFRGWTGDGQLRPRIVQDATPGRSAAGRGARRCREAIEGWS